MRVGRPRTRRGVLVLAPHADDAALSVGGTLVSLPPPVTILTVFGRSNYTHAGGFERAWSRVTAARRAEDAAYARSVGARLLDAGLADASLRFRGVMARIFPRSERAVTLPRRLAMVLDEVLAQCRPRLMLAPAGIGRHVDHVAVRQAARALASRHGVPLAIYEDLPYAAGVGEERLCRHLQRIDARLQPRWLPLGERLGEKLRRLDAYPSQLNEHHRRAVAAHAARWPGLGPCERLWACSPLPSSFPAASFPAADAARRHTGRRGARCD